MSKTFYVAGASRNGGVWQAQAVASYLEELGYYNEKAWWDNLGAPAADWPRLAEEDISAAVSADIFVYLAQPESVGAAIEFGARLGSGKPAYVVYGAHELFVKHPLVRHFNSVGQMFSTLLSH